MKKPVAYLNIVGYTNQPDMECRGFAGFFQEAVHDMEQVAGVGDCGGTALCRAKMETSIICTKVKTIFVAISPSRLSDYHTFRLISCHYLCFIKIRKIMISINPYLNFMGNTGEAMKFYQSVFGV